MDPGALIFLIPIAAIMGGLVKIARHWGPGYQGQGGPVVQRLEARLEAMEQQLDSLQQQSSDTDERLDFAERLLAQEREGKRLGPSAEQ